ncbi:murein DD-endopeptidase MepM/ murein hydrolase activator NlpD [Paraburkholderia bannensis]|uniref:Murein DD-endopeptidase MepM/ murein hydrolase activator NlpD n=1 Tax=Paraburkholderia bannensis TaxID=765414 RepID=A0A7W9TYZ4_9BURK|nr:MULTISPECIES: peptidoglycan DD-metalloendopeptidase family protein [Paraburkholderia]MBB3257762.1 murein DD-endopeptidase MepM/ murein hydrolase activator NlpD [Paraburkholderia sp. WP4_3_2]MBB6102775.1 murein DD-endopeptidase MepM/ murein hydrolase activator NlpD [Paraburkholderia bannensis]
MPKLVSTTSSGVAGKAFIVAALSTACTAWLSHQMPSQSVDVSLHASDDLPEQLARRALAPAAASVPAPVPSAPAYHVETVRVTHSFSEAADQLGIDAATTAKLAHALEGRLDLRRDLRPGSEVRFVFRDKPGAAPATSAAPAVSDASATPVAMRISTGKESHDLFLFSKLDGKAFYYSADGTPAAPTFLRYPVNFTRVSSEFSPLRLDPVTHRWAAHEGVDLAAPIGTPVRATAQGTVTFAGWEIGYGRVIKIQNFGDYSTTFAHLSRFAKSLHAGQQVKQGQVIGYVGKTGWATGPHLHYEVHVDNVAQDPLSVDLPVRTVLEGDDRQHFAQQVQQIAPML